MDLTAEAINELKESGIKPSERLVSDGRGRVYGVDNNGRFDVLGGPEKALELNTLSGMVDYIKSGLDLTEGSYLLQIVDETQVELKTGLVEGGRKTLARSTAIIPKLYFDTFLDTEKLNIALQSNFEKTEDRDILLQVVGNIRDNNVKTIGDDGVSQAVTINQGVASAADVKVPNPVTLAPYRTFTEIYGQPESEFIFRMQEGPRGGLFEADGGKWRHTAIERIAFYLNDKLADLIEAKKIILIA